MTCASQSTGSDAAEDGEGPDPGPTWPERTGIAVTRPLGLIETGQVIPAGEWDSPAAARRLADVPEADAIAGAARRRDRAADAHGG